MIQKRIAMILALQIAIGLLFVALTATGQQSRQRGELEILTDKPAAPHFRLPDTLDGMHDLGDYRGKAIIVNFWATWCIPCRREMPSMQSAWEQLQDRDVMLLGINWGDSEDSIERFFANLHVDFPILMDKDKSVTTEWGVRGLPTTYVVDPQGRLVYRIVGERHWDEPELMQRVLDLHQD